MALTWRFKMSRTYDATNGPPIWQTFLRPREGGDVYRERFCRAIREKQKVRVTFFSQEDQTNLIRTCAPMDYAAGKRIRLKRERYWVWDYDSDAKEHVLGLRPEQVVDMMFLEEPFDPAEFVTWRTEWAIERDWGPYS